MTILDVEEPPTREQLREKLDELEVSYNAKASGIVLYHLLMQTQRDGLAELAGVDPSELSARAAHLRPVPDADKPPEQVPIQEALRRCMSDIGAIGKTQRVDVTDGPRFNFRGIDQMLDASHPVFAKHGVIPLPEVLDLDVHREGKKTHVIATMRYRFVGPQGDSLDAVTLGEAFDWSDKACSKAMSTAFKYALVQVLTIPLADIRDSDQGTEEASLEPWQHFGWDSQQAMNDRVLELERRARELRTALGKDADEIDHIRAAREAVGWPNVTPQEANRVETVITSAELVAATPETPSAAPDEMRPQGARGRRPTGGAEDVAAPALAAPADEPTENERPAPQDTTYPCRHCGAQVGFDCETDCIMWEKPI